MAYDFFLTDIALAEEESYMQGIEKISDEPTRLANIVSKIFSDQSGWSHRLEGGGLVQLRTGVEAQDDCAVFHIEGAYEIVMGSDYVRGAKFSLYERGYLDNYDVGYYLTMANFSDVAAMGAQPTALLSVIRYPKSMSDEDFRSVVQGIADACSAVGALNVGGDIGTAERLILSASAIGVVEAGHSLLRSGARCGDRLCVTGPTGLAAAAQQYFGVLDVRGVKISAADEELLISSWKRPRARVKEGRLLSTSGVVTSCQDSSDGLKASIQTIAARSNVGFVVEEGALPVVDVVAEVAKLSDNELTPLLLGDSVDFQLVFTVPNDAVAGLRLAFREHDVDFTEIGVATEDTDVVLRGADGTLSELPGAGWRHAT